MLKKIVSNPFILFPLLTCIFFWPITFQLFTLKNDALTYYYPVRTLISDALKNHELPLWTPFINMGYPLHADMQSGAWNPVIWMFGFATNYSLAAFQYELLFYFAAGGIGFYYLGREQGWNKFPAVLTGFAYEFSGPMIDSVQFSTCISSACYIPFIFLFFKRLLQFKKQATNALLTGFFLYLFFTGGYPGLFIITLYLLAAFLMFAFFTSPNKKEFSKKLAIPLGILSLAFFLLSLPAIISFINHLEFIERGKKQGLEFVLENSLPPSCMFSLISPFSTTSASSFFNTDVLMRNIYTGIVPLIFLIYALSNKAIRNSRETRFFLITAFILFGMAWGSYFFLRTLAYYVLPLMNTFRHPALFRFFGVIFLLLIAGAGLHRWIEKKECGERLKKIILGTGVSILLISVCIILFTGGTLIPANLETSQLKTIVASLGFRQRFLIQLPFIITVTGCLYYFISATKARVYILILSVTDLFFATQLNIPITVIGSADFSSTELFIDRNPVRFPLPGNASIRQNSLHSFDTNNTIGSKLPFVKRIGRNDYFITPGNLSLQEKFYASTFRDPVFNNPPLYFADTIFQLRDTAKINVVNKASFAILSSGPVPGAGVRFNSDTISIKKLSANRLDCAVEATTARLLVLLQNSYPGWKVFVDGTEASLLRANISFMAVNVPAGKHSVVFSYQPGLIRFAWYISVITLSGIGFFFMWSIFGVRAFPQKHH
ncbi:MAG: YfhO family protein [Ferruginibacter sp.]